MTEPTQPEAADSLPTELDATPAGAVAEEHVAPPSSGRVPLRVFAELGKPFRWGFLATVGCLVALAIGGAVSSLSTVLMWMAIALFIALALDPVVRWLERHHLRRGLSIAIVFVVFALVLAGLAALVVPTAVTQISEFAKSVPGYITDLQNAAWFQEFLAATGQSDWYQKLLNEASTWLSDPANLLTLGGGALSVGSGIVDAASGSFVVLVLTLYFLASLRSIKTALVRLGPAYTREKTASFADRMTDSVGNYVSGMAILAMCNAVFSFIVLSLLGVPFAALLAVAALLLTMIPMIGSPVFWFIATVVSLFTSWQAALIWTIAYNVYIQVEAYVMTPRVMNKAVSIPGILVVIGVLVGGTLLGLLGALVAVPVTASLLMIVQEVFLPRQDAKTVEPD